MSGQGQQQQFLTTSFGGVLVRTNGPTSSGKPALLLLHGNSLSSSIFKHILASPISQTRRIVAFDYPGHGASSNASEPEKAYTQPAFAQAAIEVLRKLQIQDVVILGWSVGGHVAIEMLPLFPGIRGLMIIATPPLPLGNPSVGFHKTAHLAAAAKETLNEAEIEAFVQNTTGGPYEDWMKRNVAGTDGRARDVMFRSLAEGTVGSDQRLLVERFDVPVAVVNGAEEKDINLEYVRSVKYKNLWKGQCLEMKGLHHAPFWESPKEFQPVLEEFLQYIDSSPN